MIGKAGAPMRSRRLLLSDHSGSSGLQRDDAQFRHWVLEEVFDTANLLIWRVVDCAFKNDRF